MSLPPADSPPPSSAAAKVSHSIIIPPPPSLPLPTSASTHAARLTQNIQTQERKTGAEQGIELNSISASRSHSLPPTATSTEDPDDFLISSDEYSDLSADDDSTSPSSQMQTRETRSSAKKSKSKSPSPDDDTNTNSTNGHATSATTMNSRAELRRKHLSLEGDRNQAENLIARNSFSLDHDPPSTPSTPSLAANNGFWDMSLQDRRNFLLLVLLYFLQGIPMGLAGGSVPFLLKRHLSYGQIGVFSLAMYPYSLKLLWSPIVDAVWSARIGRRKSWIVPIQFFAGLGMIWLGRRSKTMLEAAETQGSSGIWSFTWWWFFLVATSATQDIAVDGWALTLLSPQNIAYASTAQTVGLTGGGFLSFTVFLAFESKDLANHWFRKVPSEDGVITLGGYLVFWGWMYMLVTMGLALLKNEERSHERDSISAVYKVMWQILQLPNIQSFIVVHLIAKLGFQANDAVTNLKLIEKKFGQDNLALTVLIDFPFEIGLGYYVGKYSSIYPPMHLWCYGFVGRLAAAAVAQFTVMIFPAGGVTTWYLLAVIGSHIFSTFTNTVMFVAASAFHAKIADPVVGGTYMTLLATVSNLGGTFPRFFILKLVDFFTAATCLPPTTKPNDKDLKGPAVTAAFSCAIEAERDRCTKGGGTCDIRRDGYYIVNILCIIVGVVSFWGYIKPTVMRLQALPLRAWRTGAHV